MGRLAGELAERLRPYYNEDPDTTIEFIEGMVDDLEEDDKLRPFLLDLIDRLENP